MIKKYIGQFVLLVFICGVSCGGMMTEPETKEPVDENPTDTDEPKFYDHATFVMGADLSYVNAIEDFGGEYKVEDVVTDPYKIFKDNGANLVRVRLWHTPDWEKNLYGSIKYHHYEDVAETIRRAHDQGMAVNLDLHYSDDWADPAKQFTPKAWEGLGINELKDSVYNYTLAVLNYFDARGLTPEYIQVGNENNGGMLFPVGRIQNNDWSNFTGLLKSGIQAVRDFSQSSEVKPKIILHVAQLQNAEWWSNGVVNIGGVQDFDIIGLSHYFIWSDITSMAGVSSTIQGLKSKYSKDVMIVETAYPWTSMNADGYNNIIQGNAGFLNYEVSQKGQFDYMRDLTQSVIDGGGIGVMYWEPAWITSNLEDQWGTGSSWENNTFFDYDGNIHEGINFMTENYKF